ncbi:hypothetical protein [Nostoc sp.]
MKTCLEPAFRLSRQESPTGNAVQEAPPPLLAAEQHFQPEPENKI